MPYYFGIYLYRILSFPIAFPFPVFIHFDLSADLTWNLSLLLLCHYFSFKVADILSLFTTSWYPLHYVSKKILVRHYLQDTLLLYLLYLSNYCFVNSFDPRRHSLSSRNPFQSGLSSTISYPLLDILSSNTSQLRLTVGFTNINQI